MNQMLEQAAQSETDDHAEHAIVLQDVSAQFSDARGGARTVLAGVDLRVPRGEFTAIVGRSGCGKTTLLNMVAGLVTPSGGTLQVLGKQPRSARHHLGFMLARDALLPWRSALRNVEYGLELRGLAKTERRYIAQRWLEAVHLGDSSSLWPWQLSQGMRQRVALARTWALDPDVLLMDEPFSALDANTRVSVQDEFLSLWQSGEKRTVLLVTHDLGEAIALADRVVLLGEGHILDDVRIDIERPRDLATLPGDSRYQAVHQRLREQLG